MKYMPNSEKCPLPYSPFKSCTVPRPIGWLSSISPDGVENLAPYSQWQNLTFDPPMVMFAANQYPDGRRKDTVINAEKTGWFVWNMVTWDLKDAMNTSAMAVPYGESEIGLAGLKTVKADLSDVPMVADSPCHFECKYISTHRLKGNSNVGTIDIVFAEVVKIHVKDEFITEEGKIDIMKARPIARMGYHDYTVVDNRFEMKIPKASDDEADGLEGRP
ncbi:MULTISPECIES: flavin reductase family protein [Halomonadaceae]|uniref:Flavin reductase family protein n=1 Tax=Chromohalobacter moromii TaxID=2860329 RepID=A0A9X2X2P4_9GAMM|nr:MULTISPECIES: flavin reductase family protein [Halomonadaceae]MCK2046068.1 flavin reductase family protein [Chromohalobacter moromii]MCO7243537.1 flavin reductase family protein [Halomonas sp. Ps84H-12]MCP1303605.1 flavin reductase family protein [Halomonas sp. R1t8]MCP1329578.1 flavin reductase family protein [Halomonas sp. R1t4]MCT8505508.1 flavin reductase family protein [Chromohalobacter moromii]